MPLAPLPIDEVLPQLTAALEAHPCGVLEAPPGAGKTTRVPPALLASAWASRGAILVLQPRRVAARATAARIARERGSPLGEEVGYQVRFESRHGPRTRICLLTEGVLLRRLLDDPFLEDVAAVVFDEFHERSLAADLALGMVRQVQQSVRPELRLLIMSATLAGEAAAAYLGNSPHITSAGRAFPVDIRHQPPLDRRDLPAAVAEAVEQALAESPGDCLVFLPGLGEIRQAGRALARLADEQRLDLRELYGDLPAEEQDAALARGPRRKVILATNVAETSLTIEGVTSVVDCGLARVLRFDERTGLDRLELGPISQASAAQRAGRAGRTQPGLCVRLWSEAAQRSRPEFELPEIRRVDLAGAVLQLLAWVEPDLERFPWFEPPPAGAVQRALDLLVRLEAVADGAISPLGRELAGLPAHPRLARLLVEGRRRNVAGGAALAAALLSERDVFLRGDRRRGPRGPSVKSRSDVLERVAALEAFEERGATESPCGELNRQAARHALRTRDQLLRLALGRPGESPPAPAGEEPLLRAILAAFPDRVARRRREPHSPRGVLVGGRGVRLAEESVVTDDELFVCVDVEGSGAEAVVRQASGISRDWLPASLMRTETQVEFDEAQLRVSARRRVFWDSLLLEESPAQLPPGEATARILANAAAPRLPEVLPAEDSAAAQFLCRARSLRAWLPQLELPALDDDQLRSLLPQVCAGCRSLADVRQGPWLAALKTLFTWPQLQALDREAPERIQIPSGRQVALRYEPGRPPILAARIQELFGLADTPRIAGGRVKVLLHLLAPNQRPQQVTDDLQSFWKNTYPQVRKDLRGRYPKHRWPEDPSAAEPASRPPKS